jgi:hypothetical protein
MTSKRRMGAATAALWPDRCPGRARVPAEAVLRAREADAFPVRGSRPRAVRHRDADAGPKLPSYRST